jgi:hypothetical protein
MSELTLPRLALDPNTGRIIYQEPLDRRLLREADIEAVEAYNLLLQNADSSMSAYDAAIRVPDDDVPLDAAQAKDILDNTTGDVRALYLWTRGEPEKIDEKGDVAPAWTEWNEAKTAALVAYGAEPEITILPDPVPESVSSRQFKLQLHIAGLTDTVEGWINSQDPTVRIAYENSGSFVRSEPMMASGFAALGFSEAEIDAFFVAAGKL